MQSNNPSAIRHLVDGMEQVEETIARGAPVEEVSQKVSTIRKSMGTYGRYFLQGLAVAGIVFEGIQLMGTLMQASDMKRYNAAKSELLETKAWTEGALMA